MSSPQKQPHTPASSRIALLPALLIAVLLGLAFFGEKGVLRAIQLNRQMDTLQADLRRMEEENARLRQEIESLRSDRRYIEGIARRELGMVGEDEVVYQFPSGGGHVKDENKH